FPDRLDGRVQGYYLTEDEDFHFRAGSYSGYNHWRTKLCRFAFGLEPQDIWTNPERYAGKPFFELIHFSDAEGAIGPETAAKLARDFQDWDWSAEKAWEKSEWDDYDLG